MPTAREKPPPPTSHAPQTTSRLQLPNTTQVPDVVFDAWLHVLPLAELKVLLYVVRRTFGFRKSADAISLRQICEGVRRRDGVVLDHGTGLSRKAASLAVQALEQRGLLRVEREVAKDGVNQVNVYSLILEQPGRDPGAEYPASPPAPVTPSERPATSTTRGVVTAGYYGSNQTTHGGGYRRLPGVGTTGYPQHPVEQHPETQQHRTRESEPQSTDAHCEENDVVVAVLVEKGISQQVAVTLATRYPEEQIRRHVDVFEHLMRSNSPLIARSPAGYLRRSIEADWAPPEDYQQARIAQERRVQRQQETAAAEEARLLEEAKMHAVSPHQRAEAMVRIRAKTDQTVFKHPPTPEHELERKIATLEQSYIEAAAAFFAEHPELRVDQGKDAARRARTHSRDSRDGAHPQSPPTDVRKESKNGSVGSAHLVHQPTPLRLHLAPVLARALDPAEKHR